MVAIAKKIFDYFDLNKRILRAVEVELFTMEVVEGKAPSQGEMKIAPPTTAKNKGARGAPKNEMSAIQQLIMYSGVLLGVYLSKILNTKTLIIDTQLDWITFGAAAFVALIIIPPVYEKLQVNLKAPFLIQLALFVQNGFFFQSFIDSLHK